MFTKTVNMVKLTKFKISGMRRDIMKYKICMLTIFIFVLKWGVFGLLLNFDLYVGYKIFNPLMGTDPK